MTRRAAGHSFPKTLRILRGADFRRVYEEGWRRSNSLCTMFFRPNGLAETRLGITTPSRLGKAVKRNRMRRRLREVFRLAYDRLPAGMDIVLNPRPAVGTIAFSSLQEQTFRLLGQAHSSPMKAEPGERSRLRRSP